MFVFVDAIYSEQFTGDVINPNSTENTIVRLTYYTLYHNFKNEKDNQVDEINKKFEECQNM